MYKLQTDSWYAERIIFLIAGIFVLGSVILGFTISYYFFCFAGFVGAMQMIFALTGFCPMAIVLNKLSVKNRLGK